MNIVQFWHSPDIPTEIKELTSTWATKNKDADHQIFDAKSAAAFMQDNYSADIAEAFCDITIPAMYCDVFRVAYILNKGGVYVDCGTQCYHPISEWGIDLNVMTLMRKWHGGVWNGLICAPASHPWLHDLWANIEAVLLNRQDGDIFSLTGPALFTAIAKKEAELDDDDIRYKMPGQDKSSRSMSVIDQADFSPHFDLVNQLKHKSRSHWSKLQNVIPLFEQHSYLLDMKSLATTQSKQLTLYLAHNLAGKESLYQYYANKDITEITDQKSTQSMLTNNVDSDYATYLLELDQLNIQNLVQQVSKSTANNISVFVDLTSCLSELHYKKLNATNLLHSLSLLCEQFKASEIKYGVMNQSAAMSMAISLDDVNSTSSLDDKVKNLLSSPALDFNIIDEALRFFFPHSVLTPIWINASDTECKDVALDNAMLEEIENGFKESNSNLLEKYPNLKTLQENSSIHSSAA